MKQKPTHLKKIDVRENTFFHFKLDASTYVLYDSDMGEPIAYGSLNLVGATIANLSPKCTIYYFELNLTDGWKMKRVYKPDKSIAENQDKTGKIKDKKEETQEDKIKK
jgi:hypothetical protein